MHLAVLPTKEMANKLVEALYQKSASGDQVDGALPKTFEIGLNRRYWIGLSDIMDEGKWTWVGLGKELDYNFWYPGQPSHGPGKQITEWIKGEHCGS